MKLGFWSLTILILLFAVVSSQPSLEEKISDNVLEKLAEEGKVNVIVRLKDNENSNIIASTINNFNENKIMHKLDKKIKNKFSSSNAFSAELTKEEIEYLLKENYVEEISYNYPIEILLDDAVDITNTSSINARIVFLLTSSRCRIFINDEEKSNTTGIAKEDTYDAIVIGIY